MGYHQRREQILQDAWIGDAVLSLYVRQRILRKDGRIDGAKAGRMTSNQLLSIVAEPSEAEAAIGRAFAGGGLPLAFQWIEDHLVPVFERQEARLEKPKRPTVR